MGGLLVRDALSRSLDLSETLGIHAVVVDALDVEARSFYVRFGGLPMTDEAMRNCLSLDTIQSALKP